MNNNNNNNNEPIFITRSNPARRRHRRYRRHSRFDDSDYESDIHSDYGDHDNYDHDDDNDNYNYNRNNGRSYQEIYDNIAKKYKSNKFVTSGELVDNTIILDIMSKQYGQVKLEITIDYDFYDAIIFRLYNEYSSNIIFPTPENLCNRKYILSIYDQNNVKLLNNIHKTIKYIINYWCKHKKHIDKKIRNQVEDFYDYQYNMQKIVNHFNRYNIKPINKHHFDENNIEDDEHFVVDKYVDFPIRVRNPPLHRMMISSYCVRYGKLENGLFSIEILDYNSVLVLNDQIISGRTEYYNMEDIINDIDIIYDKCSNLLLDESGRMEYVKEMHLEVLKSRDFNPYVFNVLPTEYHEEYISTSVEIKSPSSDNIRFDIINYYDTINRHIINKYINNNLTTSYNENTINDYFSFQENISKIFNKEISNLYDLNTRIMELKEIIINNYDRNCASKPFLGRCCLRIFNVFEKNYLLFKIQNIKNQNIEIEFFPFFIPDMFGYLHVIYKNNPNVPDKFRGSYVKINDIHDLFFHINDIKDPVIGNRKDYLNLHNKVTNYMNEIDSTTDNSNISEAMNNLKISEVTTNEIDPVTANENISKFVCDPYMTRELLSYLFI